MIRNIRHKGLRAFYDDDDPRGISQSWLKRIKVILTRLEASTKPSDMDLPGLRLHLLEGDLKAFILWTYQGTGGLYSAANDGSYPHGDRNHMKNYYWTTGKTSKRKSGTDWEALRRMNDVEIRAGIEADPDANATDDGFWKEAKGTGLSPAPLGRNTLDSRGRFQSATPTHHPGRTCDRRCATSPPFNPPGLSLPRPHVPQPVEPFLIDVPSGWGKVMQEPHNQHSFISEAMSRPVLGTPH